MSNLERPKKAVFTYVSAGIVMVSVVLAVIGLEMGLTAVRSLRSMRQADETLYQAHTAPLPRLAGISFGFYKQLIATRDLLAAAAPADQAKFEKEVESLTQQLNTAVDEYAGKEGQHLSLDGRVVFHQFLKSRKLYASFQEQIIATAKRGRPNDGWALLWSPQFHQTLRRVIGSLEAIQLAEIASSRETVESNRELTTRSLWT